MANLPVKGSIGFIVFLSSFFVLSIISIVINQDSSIPTYFKVFLWTLVVGMFICILQCITYLDKYKSLLTESIEDDEVILFTTCPDYWTKYIAKSATSNNTYEMCRNKNNKGQYVAGSVKKVVGTGGSYTFQNDLLSSASNTVTVEDLRAEAPQPQDSIESFSEPNPNEHTHKFTRVYEPAYISGTNFFHTHPTATFTTTGHAHDTTGGDAEIVDPSYVNYVESCDDSIATDKCNTKNWISSGEKYDEALSEGDITSMDINLTALNKITDQDAKCNLAKNYFQWTEAITKCD